MINRRLAFVMLALASCQTPPGSFAPAPTPATPPPVIGHWNLEAPSPGEHLWIEAGGTFAEAGGPPPSGSSFSPPLSAGTWTYAAPTLTLDDAQTGPQALSATIAGGRLTLVSAANVFYVLRREQQPDAGAD